MTIGELLRQAREKKGLTQADVAKKLGKTQPAVAGWESDQSLPKTDEVRDVAAAYGVKPLQLLPERRSS